MSCHECSNLATRVGFAGNDLVDGRRKLARKPRHHDAAAYAAQVDERKRILEEAHVALDAHQADCEHYAAIQRRKVALKGGAPILTDDDLAEIRERRAAGEPVRDLALAFGVNEGVVSRATAGVAENRRFIRADEPWMADALCAQMGYPDGFFPDKVDSVTTPRRVCQLCEVRDACLDYALRLAPTHGMWGGLTPRELTKLRHQREAEARTDLPAPSEAAEPGPGGEATTSAA